MLGQRAMAEVSTQARKQTRLPQSGLHLARLSPYQHNLGDRTSTVTVSVTIYNSFIILQLLENITMPFSLQYYAAQTHWRPELKIIIRIIIRDNK